MHRVRFVAPVLVAPVLVAPVLVAPVFITPAAAGPVLGAPVLTAPVRSHGPAPRRPSAGAPISGAHISATRGRRGAAGVLDPHRDVTRAVQSGSAGRRTAQSVTVTGADTAALARAVHARGGTVVAATPGRVSALVSSAQADALRANAVVRSVTPAVRAFDTSGPVSEGIAASGAGPGTAAGTWQAAGLTGKGVTVAVVDTGFAGLADAARAGDLPSGQGVAGSHCDDVDGSAHGTAVAEVVHQMAPGATLLLYCVSDNVGFAQAESELQAAGVRIVNSSLAFPGDSRGDGTGAAQSTAATVRTARQAGILWVESAGNSALDHWGGTFTDADHDGLLDLGGAAGAADEFDSVEVPGTDNNGGRAAFGAVFLQWDQWPVSSAPVTLRLVGDQCTDDLCSGTVPLNHGNPYLVTHPAGTAPVLEFDLPNSGPYDQVWYVYVQLGSGVAAVRYSLSEEGAVSPSYLAGEDPARAAAGSIEMPAGSPYALAVGASDVGADGTRADGAAEAYSSRGPTIDNRPKPEITGWDGVSSPVYGAVSPSGGGFFGTSAAAPAVAGAAALVRQADPNLDASGLQSFLERRAQHGSPYWPPAPAVGHGVLTLGAPSGVTGPVTSRYTATSPHRVLDTRTGAGGHLGALGVDGIVSITVTAPADATAVALNLTGTGATATTYLTAYRSATTLPPTANLNLSAADPTAAVFAVVPIGADHSVTVFNRSGATQVVVDELGWFATSTGTGRYTALTAPTRVLDTRTATGGHHAPVGNGGTVTVHPGLPAGTSAAVVNVTASSAGAGYLSASPTCTHSTSTLNYDHHARANLAIVSLSGRSPGFCVSNVGAGADVIVDVLGYLGPNGSGYVPLPSPQRIVDTRVGEGVGTSQAASRPLGPGSSTAYYVSGVGDVPANTTGVLAGFGETTNTAGGYLAVVPGTNATGAGTSEVNFTPGRSVPNADLIGVRSHQLSVYNRAGYTHLTVDLSGYFVAD